MSADPKKKKGFEPAGQLPAKDEQEPPKDPTQQIRALLQTATDLNDHINEQSQKQAKYFKELFEESSLPIYVKIAGASALLAFLLELARMVWLIVRYKMGF
jgi:hypothetical protein